VRFIFGIPRGTYASQSPPGEISHGQLNTVIHGPSADASLPSSTFVTTSRINRQKNGGNRMKPILLPPFFCLPPGKITNHGDAKNNAVSTLDTAFADPDMETIRQKLTDMILNGRRAALAVSKSVL
jgi:hypothetical protein